MAGRIDTVLSTKRTRRSIGPRPKRIRKKDRTKITVVKDETKVKRADFIKEFKATVENNKKENKVKINLWPIALIATAILATLKLTNQIDWSWWVVFSPILAVLAIMAFVLIFVVIILGLVLKYGD